jgi:hypothetical protein
LRNTNGRLGSIRAAVFAFNVWSRKKTRGLREARNTKSDNKEKSATLTNPSVRHGKVKFESQARSPPFFSHESQRDMPRVKLRK